MNTRWLTNPDDGRLRAGWRILIFIVLLVAINTGLSIGLRAMLGGLPRTSYLVFVILATSATLATWLARRFLDKKDFLSLGLTSPRMAVQDLSFGFVLSGVMAAAVFGAMVALGHIDNVEITVSGAAALSLLALPLFVTALVGFWEELVFRGYLLQNMAEGMGMKTAVVVSCILYGAVHAFNPGAGVLSTLIIVLFGYLRIYGYLASGLLWLPMGMHIGWNFFQASVFGYAASGHAEDETLFRHEPAAADWLSGGAFGPEASVLTIPVVLAALVAMRAWARRRAAVTT
jgi:membrane protease YdiL (CAAX protease family)